MLKEIGSEFHISLKDNNKHGPNQRLMDEIYQDHVYVRSGREAIGFVLDEIKVNTKIALLPTYICKSMIEPFLKRGFTIVYFSIDSSFNPNIKEVEKLLDKNPDIVLIIDWFGMNKNKEIISLVRSICKDIIILEDSTHNLFNDSKLTKVDYTIASLRKWFALPDGAIAINHKGSFNNRIEFKDNLFVNKRKKAMLLKAEYLDNDDRNLKIRYRKLLSEAEHFIDIEDTLTGISNYSLSLINQIDFTSMKIKRRENFNTLYKLIDKSKVIPIVNKIAGNNECPFCFPILINNRRDELQIWLAEKNIYCPVLWPLREDIYFNYEVSAYISDNMLSIPCDQRYSIDDMEYVAKTINAFFRGEDQYE